jgi:hypothetical protein
MDDIIDIRTSHARRFWEKWSILINAIDDFASLYSDMIQGFPKVHFRTVLDVNPMKIRCLEALKLFQEELLGYDNVRVLPTRGTAHMDINNSTDRIFLSLVVKDLYRKLWSFHSRYHPHKLQPGYPVLACALLSRDTVVLRELIFKFVHTAFSFN